jgi:rubrerythrin
MEAAARAATPRQRDLLLRLAEEELAHRENLLNLLQAAKAQLEIDRAISGDTLSRD